MEAPEFFHGAPPAGDPFAVEDLLDFSCDDDDAGISDVIVDAAITASSTTVSPSSAAQLDSYGIPAAGVGDTHLSGELSVPCDDLAELEWLSNFVEESFSSEDLQKLELSQLTAKPSSQAARPEPNRIFQSIVGKARSKRSRAVHCNWSSRLLVERKSPPLAASGGGEGRRCLHCATDKTPQWRTGPMGPKTLCNACGVRYKSGRLVPEYRPAASPTFMLTKHSNSHRKVLELRRQKELERTQQQQQNQFFHPSMMFGSSNGDDYLIYQPMGPDFTHII